MLDPVESCPGPADVALAHEHLVAAYITLVAASIPHPLRDGPMWRLQSLRLPAHSRMYKHARAQEYEPDGSRTKETISSASRSTSESMDEVWLRADAPPPPCSLCTVIPQCVYPLMRGAHADANAAHAEANALFASQSRRSVLNMRACDRAKRRRGQYVVLRCSRMSNVRTLRTNAAVYTYRRCVTHEGDALSRALQHQTCYLASQFANRLVESRRLWHTAHLPVY